MKYQEEITMIKNAMQFVKKNYLSQSARNDAKHFDKGSKDVVTEMDLAIEKYLISIISKKYPNDKFVTEEFNGDNELTKDRTWTIDPIDGTINYALGSALYGCQLALVINKKPVFSYILLPDLGNEFIAVENEGTFLNGEKITISSDVKINHAVVSIGGISNYNQELAKYELELIREVMKNAMTLRLWGSSAYDTTSLTLGISHIFFMFAQHIWDAAPGILIAKEAGCIVTKVDGSPIELGVPSYLLCVNQELTDFVSNCNNKIERYI